MFCLCSILSGKTAHYKEVRKWRIGCKRYVFFFINDSEETASFVDIFVGFLETFKECMIVRTL